MGDHEPISATRHESQDDLLDRWTAKLREAFAGEAATVQRYTAFAQTAEIEGRLEDAGLFRDLAASTACAAQGHIDILAEGGDPATGRPLGETTLSLTAALVSEQRGATELYPGLASAALKDGLDDLGSWLTTLAALKQAHATKLRQALGPPTSPTSRPAPIGEPE